ncbi:hypothetical protein B0O99DRAFT_622993 [Bisporella sp. PMI_857]|nr:hypothetical protein B0O99DRAFT_622993 [Bisporella sp. PMI_857]
MEYFCSPEAKTCLEAALSEGTSCTFDGQCAYNRCLDGVCKKPPGSYGSPCSTSSECDTPLVCYTSLFFDGKRCLNKDGSVGSPCSSGSDCKGTMTCDSGTCTLKKCTGALGGCSTNDDCCSKDCSVFKFCN